MERLLISTYNKLILWDGRAHVIHEGRDHRKYHNFYGVTWNENEIFVAEGGHVSHSTYHVFDKNLKRTGKLPIGLDIGDPHQIYYYDGKMYIASAWHDAIFIWDGRKCSKVQWRYKESTLHLNSVWTNGAFFYVVEHRKRETPKRVMVLNMDFEPIGRVEIPAEGFVKTKPHGIHNVYLEGDFLYTCSPRAFVRFNIVTKRAEPVVPSGLVNAAHYVRGLARVPSRWFIGLSEAKVRNERGQGDSAILVLHDDLTVEDVIPLDGTGGLNEIRAIDGPDLAHNGIECPYGRSA